MAMKIKGMRLNKTAIALVVVLAMITGAFMPVFNTLPVAKAAPIGGKYGGYYRIALKAEPGVLNPLSNPDANTYQVIDLIYDSLARRDPATLELKPWIARSWTVNGLNFTVEIRDDVYWHDGAKLTVNDVKYTYTLPGYGPSNLASVNAYAKTNKVSLIFSQTNGAFVVDGLLVKLVKDGFTNASAPNGCGPYKFLSRLAGSNIKLSAFDTYFNGRPYLDGITYTYSTSTDQTMVDLMNGTVDFIGWNLDVADVSKNMNISGKMVNMMTFENTTVERTFGTDFLYLGFNCQPNNPLNALALRKAITSCVDKASIAQLDVSGSARATESIISPRDQPWYNSSIVKYKFDLSVANSVLDQAGYFDINGDGWRELPNGTAFSVRMLLPKIEESLTLVTIGQQIVSVSIEKVGVNVTLVNQPIADMASILVTNDFDMYLGFENRGTISPMFMKDLFYSTNVATNTNLMNFAGTTEQINGTVEINVLNHTAQLNRTNLDSTKPVLAYKNTALWGVAKNQTVMVYKGVNYSLLGNVSINTGFMLFKNGVKVASNLYSVDMATGNLTLTFPAGGIDTGDVINATYTYQTYDSLDYKKGTIRILNNYDFTKTPADKLKFCFTYRGLDDAMDQLAGTMNATNVQKYAMQAQGFLSDQVPVAPVMSYMVLNAYNNIKYTGWVSMLGGINNFWSFLSLQNNLVGPGGSIKSLTIDAAAYPGYVNSNETLKVDITVKDGDANPMKGATIVPTVSAGKLSAITDNGDGTYKATYTAPASDVTVSANLFFIATVSGYLNGFTNESVTIHPVQKILAIQVTLGNRTIDSGGSTSIKVTVTDEKSGGALSGASVIITVEPAGVGGWVASGTGTTSSTGVYETTLNTQNVSVDTTFRIVVSVTKKGYVPDSATANVAVARYGGEKQGSSGFLGLPALSSVTGIVAIAAAALIFGAMRKRRKL